MCMYKNWCEGITDATTLSLAVKGAVVAEKRSTHSAVHVFK
jgi:hypothetical protein